MRGITIFVILGVSIFLFSCMENNVPPVSYGFVNAEIDGKDWNKTYKNAYQATYALIRREAPCSEYVVLISELYTNEGNIIQFFEIKKLPLQIGKYRIRPLQMTFCADTDPLNASIYTFIGGDVVGDMYNVLDSKENFVEIESYNPKTKEIKGRFEITFAMERRGPSHTLPDTMCFANGRFNTRVITVR